MPVDMYERRFIEELEKVDPFVRPTGRSVEVWSHDFPAWRPLFSSLCFYGHSTGYRLFSFEKFFGYVRQAWCTAHPHPDRFKRFFEGSLLSGMRERVGVWYESGMAETHLYTCLVEAIEDKMKAGVVLYDTRVDFKLKGDAVLIVKGKAFMVNSYFGDADGRSAIEARRDAVEHVRKVNTQESAHWENKELDAMRKFSITRTDDDCRTVNGVKLFSMAAINRLLDEIYAYTGKTNGYHIYSK